MIQMQINGMKMIKLVHLFLTFLKLNKQMANHNISLNFQFSPWLIFSKFIPPDQQIQGWKQMMYIIAVQQNSYYLLIPSSHLHICQYLKLTESGLEYYFILKTDSQDNILKEQKQHSKIHMCYAFSAQNNHIKPLPSFADKINMIIAQKQLKACSFHRIQPTFQQRISNIYFNYHQQLLSQQSLKALSSLSTNASQKKQAIFVWKIVFRDELKAQILQMGIADVLEIPIPRHIEGSMRLLTSGDINQIIIKILKKLVSSHAFLLRTSSFT